jgi:hypothetical protein
MSVCVKRNVPKIFINQLLLVINTGTMSEYSCRFQYFLAVILIPICSPGLEWRRDRESEFLRTEGNTEIVRK